MTDKISSLMQTHYSETFKKHGCTSAGVDWGTHEDRALLRHRQMLDIIEQKPCSVLDVGCGYGALLDVAGLEGINYTGIDMVEAMIEQGRKRHSEAAFLCGDFLDYPFELDSFDYVICNGILTQRLTASIADMDIFSKKIIRRMFATCRRGIALNMMTSHVNFMTDTLFYRNPLEMLAWIMAEISPSVKLNHAYPLYEFTLHAYKRAEGNLQSG